MVASLILMSNKKSQKGKRYGWSRTKEEYPWNKIAPIWALFTSNVLNPVISLHMSHVINPM